MENVDNVHKQMNKVSRDIKTLKKNQKEMLEIKKPSKDTKNVFHELISRLDMIKERISGLEDISRNFPH